MSTIQDVTAEQLAKIFHHYQEALAHDHASTGGANGASAGSSAWERIPLSERKLMIAAARLALLELSSTPVASAPGRKYYAKPGEANWGC